MTRAITPGEYHLACEVMPLAEWFNLDFEATAAELVIRAYECGSEIDPAILVPIYDMGESL